MRKHCKKNDSLPKNLQKISVYFNNAKKIDTHSDISAGEIKTQLAGIVTYQESFSLLKSNKRKQY